MMVKTGLLAASISAAAVSPLMPPSISLAPPASIGIAPHDFAYRVAGDFNQYGRPVDAPLIAIARNASLHIMKRQVTTMEYDHCVSDAKCAPKAPSEDSYMNLPVTRERWLDATAYASWHSARTGERWRLPTDEEWAFVARLRFHDDALPVAATRDPSVRWLDGYERETEEAAFDQKPRLAALSAPMNSNCWICREMSGYGQIPISSAALSTRWASRWAMRSRQLRGARGRGCAPRLCH